MAGTEVKREMTMLESFKETFIAATYAEGALQLTGMGLSCYGISLWSVPAALTVGGIALFVYLLLLPRSAR